MHDKQLIAHAPKSSCFESRKTVRMTVAIANVRSYDTRQSGLGNQEPTASGN